MKKHVLAVAVLAAVSGATWAADATNPAGPWMVRARAVYLDSDNKDTTGLGLTVNNKWLPEVDFSYFFTPNLAAELILTVPQKHSLYSNGKKIGTLKHLPPTLTLQYHFTGMGSFKPYVGAGLNFTKFTGVHLDVAGANIDRDSWGLAAQAGVDVPVGKNMYLNFDVKYAQIRTDVTLNGAKIGEFKVDPWLVGVGLGWRF